MTTIAKLFDPRGGHSVISDRCEVCNEPIEEGSGPLCDACDWADMEDDDE